MQILVGYTHCARFNCNIVFGKMNRDIDIIEGGQTMILYERLANWNLINQGLLIDWLKDLLSNQ